jgi:hypothetical protein
MLFLFFCCFIMAIGKYLLVLFLFLFCLPLIISCYHVYNNRYSVVISTVLKTPWYYNLTLRINPFILISILYFNTSYILTVVFIYKQNNTLRNTSKYMYNVCYKWIFYSFKSSKFLVFSLLFFSFKTTGSMNVVLQY